MNTKPPTPYLFGLNAVAFNLNDLVSLCDRHWEDAKAQLLSGSFEAWLRDIDLSELAEAAKDARTSKLPADDCLIAFLTKCGPAGDEVARRKRSTVPASTGVNVPKSGEPCLSCLGCFIGMICGLFGIISPSRDPSRIEPGSTKEGRFVKQPNDKGFKEIQPKAQSDQ